MEINYYAYYNEIVLFTTPEELRGIADLLDEKLKNSKPGDNLIVFSLSTKPNTKQPKEKPIKVKFMLDHENLWIKKEK